MSEGTCIGDGCSTPVGKKSRRRMCPFHYRRWRRSQGAGFVSRTPTRHEMTLEDILARAAAIPFDANGCRDGRGTFAAGPREYPRATIEGCGVAVTRLVLAAHLGRELGPGMKACHRCDRPYCCFWGHLFEGTDSDNQRDSVAKGRNADHRGVKAPSAKLTEAQVREIRASAELGIVLAARYGVRPSTISCVRLRQTWKHID